MSRSVFLQLVPQFAMDVLARVYTSSITLAVTIAVGGAALYLLSNRQKLPLPPGPKGWPLIGNVADMPSSREWETYQKWAARYQDIMHLNLFGKHMIVLNSPTAVKELLQKRALNYSHRPHSVMLKDLMGWTWSLTLMSGEPHREHRMLVDRYFVGHVDSWQRIQFEETLTLMKRLLSTPDDFLSHIQRWAAGIVLRIGYGYHVQDHNDPILPVVEGALETSSQGTTLVDIFPILKYYPEWLPFGQFQKFAREARLLGYSARDMPFAVAVDNIVQGTAEPSFVSTQLEETCGGDVESEQAKMVRNAAAVMYAAATDTTSATLSAFLLAMVRFPEVQKRAQRELDAVVGDGRLPLFADRDSLPYVEYLIKELLRWHTVTPLALPHLAVNDDTYSGYLIPAGSTVSGNVWAILHDATTFPNPEDFNPERFAGADGKGLCELVDMAFGWGRRICPGRNVAEASLFIAIATFLAVFDVTRAKEADGTEISPTVDFSSGVVRRPVPFACTIRPRSEQARSIVSDDI